MNTSATIQRQFELTIMQLQRRIRKAMRVDDLELMEKLSRFLEQQMASYSILMKDLAALQQIQASSQPATKPAEDEFVAAVAESARPESGTSDLPRELVARDDLIPRHLVDGYVAGAGEIETQKACSQVPV